MRVRIQNGNGTTEISQLIQKIVWSGDKGQVARKLELDVLTSPTDSNIPRVILNLGNVVYLLTDDGKELFRGFVFDRERTTKGATLKITAYDGAIYLLKNKGAYNFKGVTAEQVAERVLKDAGVPFGQIAKTGYAQSFIITDKTYFQIISEAYQNATLHTGKKYVIRMVGGKLSIVERGSVVANGVLNEGENLTASTYAESLEDMVNKVVIVDQNANVITTVTNGDWMKAYGAMQEVARSEKNVDPKFTAKQLLKGISQRANVEGFGDTNLVTGCGVKVKDSYTGVTGLFLIDQDEHTWEKGNYKVKLTLDFDKLL